MKDYSYGNFICALREGAGLSQYQLGALVGVSDKAVSKWENGSTKPRTKTLYRLAAVLGISVDELLSCECNAPWGRKESQNMKNELWAKAAAALAEKYGDDLRCRSRFESEKAALKNSDAIFHFALIGDFITKARSEGIPVFTHGLLGNSLTAWLLGATDVNPLPPHEYCPKCRKIVFHDEPRDAWDMPPHKCDCGETLLRDGHRLPIESFADSISRSSNGFDILVPLSRLDTARELLFEAYARHFSPTQIECLPPDEVADKVDITSIKLMLLPKSSGTDDAKGELRKMSSAEYLNKFYSFPAVTILGLPMLDELMRRSGGDIQPDPNRFLNSETLSSLLTDKYSKLPGSNVPQNIPRNFSGLLHLEGILHSTSVWEGNGDSISAQKPERFMALAAYREDVWDAVSTRLGELGVHDSGLAFAITEDVRLGRYLRSPEKSSLHALKSLGLPEWYVEHLTKIMYVFPKAHGISHLIAELQLEWNRIH